MRSLRRKIATNRGIAALIVAAALLLRVLVPAGFMPDFSGGGVTLSLCTGTGPATMAMPMHGMVMPGGRHAPGPAHEGGKADMPCGFSGLATPGLAGADPIQLALAVAYIVVAVQRAAPAAPMGQHPRLRPPLRGPPSIA